MAQTVERSADRSAHRPGFSVSRGQQAQATRRSREDLAAGKPKKTLAHAEKVTKHEVDRDSAEQVKTAVNPPLS